MEIEDNVLAISTNKNINVINFIKKEK